MKNMCIAQQPNNLSQTAELPQLVEHLYRIQSIEGSNPNPKQLSVLCCIDYSNINNPPSPLYCPVGHSSGTPDDPVPTSQLSHSQDTPRLDSTELQDNPEACPELLVMDLRSYTAVLGNRAKGGGCECTGEVYTYTTVADLSLCTVE